MEGGRAVCIRRVNVCTCFEQKLDRFDLLLWRPRGAARMTVRGVVEWLAAPMVGSRNWVGARFEQEFDDVYAMTGCRRVEGGVTGIDPVRKFPVEVRAFNRDVGERWVILQELAGQGNVIGDDRCKEFIEPALHAIKDV